MKILSAEQLRQADAFTIENEPVSSVDLMERATTLLYQNFKQKFSELYFDLKQNQRKAVVLCGSGNNGGDGLVLGRLLHEDGIDVILCHIGSSQKSADFQANESRCKALGISLIEIENLKSFPEIDGSCIVFDALFGSGLNRPIEGFVAKAIDWINKQSAALKVAIDIPSGLFADSNKANSGAIFQANFTFTFQTPKLCFMHADWGKYVGDFQIIDIGISQKFLEVVQTQHYFISPQLLQLFLKSRAKFSHKGTYGHTLIIAGSEGKYGAAMLASAACLRSGSGLVTLYSDAKAVELTVAKHPEIMGIDRSNNVDNQPNYLAFSALAIGPGLGTYDASVDLVKQTIQSGKPVVIDADALNCLSENKTWLHFLVPGSILTPHPKEFDRLFGVHKTSEERFETAKRKALELKVIIVVKGAHSVICCPDGLVFFNSTGNPGMATAGSGDVLTGIISGLLAQNYSPKQAAILGVYIHGLAGDIALEKSSEEALIASDIISNIGLAFKTLHAL